MKKLLAALVLAASGCAHGSAGGSAHLSGKPHAELTLVGPTGLSEEQEPVLEDAICQAMVEQNHGDVACPASTKAVLGLTRMRSLAGGDARSGDQVLDAVNKPTARVAADVARDGEKWVLTLKFQDSPDSPASATRSLAAGSFEDLVKQAPEATKALLE